jgi:hypothetical protein
MYSPTRPKSDGETLKQASPLPALHVRVAAASKPVSFTPTSSKTASFTPTSSKTASFTPSSSKTVSFTPIPTRSTRAAAAKGRAKTASRISLTASMAANETAVESAQELVRLLSDPEKDCVYSRYICNEIALTPPSTL